MIPWVHFMLYMTNWTIPNPIVIPNVVSAIECGIKTTSANSTSYFYNRRSKDCIVNPMPPFHTTDNLTEASGFLYFLKDAPKCGPPLVIENAKLMNVSQSNDGVYIAYYYCPKVYHFMVVSTSTCTGTTWSDGVECIALDSCNAVKTCNPGYTTDGEFWLYPSGLDHQRARIYCNDMNAANPNEYLTLLWENYAEFPPGHYIENSGCTLDTRTIPYQGKTYFNKIRIYVENMTVEQTDYSFTFQSYDNPVPYGSAKACSTQDTNICPQRGSALLNLTSTGLIISSTTEWVKNGWIPYLTVVERTDVVVVLTGDGGCGGALSNGPIKLQFDSSYMYMTRWSLLLDGEVHTTLYTCANAAKNNNHESFFYNKDSKVCIVNDIKIHTTNSLVPQTGFVYYVLHGPKCGPPPVIPNAVLEDVKYMSGDIYTAIYSCITGFYFPALKTSTCSGTTWSTGVYCKALSSCSDIRTCNPSHSDGEYWLYPDVYDHKKVKIYCHGMDTGNPMEYMTLIRSNVMEFPLGKYRRNTGCLVTTSGSTKEGKTRFSRVRILPENMTIQSSDKRFSTQIYGTISLGYGHAAACSVYDTKICPLRGKSTIDITSTGLVFGSSNEWKGLGHFPSFDVVSHDHVIHVKADGGCGSAEPKSPIKLELDSTYRPSLDSATDPVCI